MNIKKLLILISLSFATLWLAACSPKPLPPLKIYQASSQRQVTLLSYMQDSGTQVITQGDRLWVIIPTDLFFEPQTTHLFLSKRQDIGYIAQFILHYIKKFPQATIRVYGYTDTTFGKKSRERLSTQYAQVISSYLWNYGLSRHRMSVIGFGAHDDIASNLDTRGKALNRRVMIAVN